MPLQDWLYSQIRNAIAMCAPPIFSRKQVFPRQGAIGVRSALRSLNPPPILPPWWIVTTEISVSGRVACEAAARA